MHAHRVSGWMWPGLHKYLTTRCVSKETLTCPDGGGRQVYYAMLIGFCLARFHTLVHMCGVASTDQKPR